MLPIDDHSSLRAALRRVEMLDPGLAHDVRQAVSEYAQDVVGDRLWTEAVETDELANSD
jgi:hypothetical protein